MPWAAPQIIRFVDRPRRFWSWWRCVDIRCWMSLAYPAYAIALLLLIAGDDVAGHVGLRRAALDHAGPAASCSRPSSMKISLVLALARYLHGLSVEDVSKPLARHSAWR